MLNTALRTWKVQPLTLAIGLGSSYPLYSKWDIFNSPTLPPPDGQPPTSSPQSPSIWTFYPVVPPTLPPTPSYLYQVPCTAPIIGKWLYALFLVYIHEALNKLYEHRAAAVNSCMHPKRDMFNNCVKLPLGLH